jgi:hypothetical protein
MKAKFQLNDTWYVAPSKNEAERFLRLWWEPFGEVLKLKGKIVVVGVERMSKKEYLRQCAVQSDLKHS